MILNDEKVKNILENFLNDNPFLEFSNEMKEDVVKVFNKIKFEKIVQDYSIYDTETLIHGIANQINYGFSYEEVYKSYMKNRHTSYYDNFIKEGASKDIENILNEYGYSTDILKGIKSYSNQELIMPDTDGRVKVINIWDNIEDGESPTLIQFDIYIDDKKVYSMQCDRYKNIVKKSDYFITKTGNLSKSKEVRKIKNIYNREYREIIDTRGITRIQDIKTGRFVKRSEIY